ncbi:hypothetical protein G3601_003822 [Salmonella enterica]|nr:hypothetical protein [Salmonella enterica]ECC8259784.1 hypothetical protein [Salmonella enterica]EDE6508828.1 hypothetical protein [Salmonella enterica subsp. enterica serovar Enteritidis]EDF0770728.1 hypothetical protein [Salmonella enterica subsp. enterica serovar Enteritidis]EEL0343728.1 hypothetical protein [Salmonella enterica]
MLNSGYDLHESIHVCNIRVFVKLIRGTNGKTSLKKNCNNQKYNKRVVIGKCGNYCSDICSITFITS